MELRLATPADRALLQYWDQKPHVVASGGVDDEGDWEADLARDVDWREILIAEVDGRPVGVMQLIDPAREETRYWGDIDADLRAVDIWIGEEDDLGRGYGTQMMRLLAARVFADPSVRAILVDPLTKNVRACRFYERLGYRLVERRRFDEDDCFVYRLNREDWSATG